MTTSKDKSNPLVRSGYLVTDATLADMARDYVEGTARADRVRGGYLRILVAHAQRHSGDAKRLTGEAALNAVEEVHAHLYAVILRAITTPDIAPEEDLATEERARRAKERNRRSTFARTAKTTLTQFIKAGGRLTTLDPKTVTKDSLQAVYASERTTESNLTRRIEQAEERMEALVKRLAAEDAKAAIKLVDSLQVKLAGAVQTAQPDMKLPARLSKLAETAAEMQMH